MRTFKCLDCGMPLSAVWYTPFKGSPNRTDDAKSRAADIAQIEATYAKEKGRPLCRACWLTRLRLDGRDKRANKVVAPS